ncbi:hypothetical protein NLM33_08270 [Bradyrhizobium sp. CCGUVB1N3]|uniref:hypothetical protein n=1 Tax=Bradyrhizobium sp. CCGUVB1N3 TaxID=2949629 RepID=UPI0020B3E744|nr:hypothetical protein [Bradyrhizobium sp. CCGUVB1N3]MCP3470316.1 hypothetical protein [Bradyrhizobium sp. CCGUVB1N3]
MHLKRLAHALVMLLVAVGLLLAPLAAPVSAMPISGDAGKILQVAPDDVQAVSDDMPCCPDETKSKTCDGCPFVALCMLNLSLPAPSGAGSLIERNPRRSALAPHDDLLRDGLAAKPPDHPPRLV